MKDLFGIMDDETSFRIAQQVADHKGTSDVRPMFREAIEVAEKLKILISGAREIYQMIHSSYSSSRWVCEPNSPKKTIKQSLKWELQR